MNKIESAVIKYAIDLERYKNGQADEIIVLLDKANDEISKFVKQTKGVYTKARYKEIAKKIKEVSARLRDEIEEGTDLDGIIDYELNKQKRLFGIIKPEIPKKNIQFLYPSREQVKTAALFKPIDTKYGMTYKSYLDGIETGLYNLWDSAVRTGYLTGQTTQQIVRDVVGTASKIGQLANPGAMHSFRNSVYGNTRTVLQSFANETMKRVYELNDDLFGSEAEDGVTYKYEYLATLDSRTCLVCANSARLYKTLAECPIIPQHRGCRCIIVPYFNIMGDTRSSKNGQVSVNISFEEWLKEQDTETQKDVLGVTRYNMFKSGTRISQFVDNGVKLTLKQLNERLSA